MTRTHAFRLMISLFASVTILTLASCGPAETPENEEQGPTTVTETQSTETQETPAATEQKPDPSSEQENEEAEQTIGEEPAAEPSALSGAVSVTKTGSLYRVVLDYSGGLSPYDLGAEYGLVLEKEAPSVRGEIDAFLYDLIDANVDMYLEDMELPIPAAFQSMAVGIVADVFYQRGYDVEPQIPAAYLDELEGLASTLCDTTADSLGDGKLSRNELFFYHLMGDTARTVQCSALGVNGAASATGEVMAARNFDLEAGIEGYGSVTRIIKEGRSVYLIGWLGCLGAFTGFNDTGVFGSIVDTTGSGEPYSSEGIYSYVYDLRYALENGTTVEESAGYMDEHPYGFNHLIFLADTEKTGVLENNISGTGSDMHRDVRYADSVLMPGIEWDYEDTVIAVSAFMLEGNHDNFSEAIIATSRFESYSSLLDEMLADGSLDWDEVKEIQSYDGNDGVPSEMEFGDIYNVGTRFIAVFKPASLELELFFAPTHIPPDDPGAFEKVTIPFGP